MLKLVDQITVLLIVAVAVAYVAGLFWSTIRVSTSDGCRKGGKCGCGTVK